MPIPTLPPTTEQETETDITTGSTNTMETAITTETTNSIGINITTESTDSMETDIATGSTNTMETAEITMVSPTTRENGNIPNTSSLNDTNNNIFMCDFLDQTNDTVFTQSSISSGFYIGGSSGLVVIVFLTGIVVLVIILFVQKKKQPVKKEGINSDVTEAGVQNEFTSLSNEKISMTKNETYSQHKGRNINQQGTAVNTLTQCNVELHDMELYYSEVTCEQEVPDTGTYMDVNQAYGKFHDSKNEVIVTSENEAYGQTTGREIDSQNIAMKKPAQFNTEDTLEYDYIQYSYR